MDAMTCRAPRTVATFFYFCWSCVLGLCGHEVNVGAHLGLRQSGVPDGKVATSMSDWRLASGSRRTDAHDRVRTHHGVFCCSASQLLADTESQAWTCPRPAGVGSWLSAPCRSQARRHVRERAALVRGRCHRPLLIQNALASVTVLASAATGRCCSLIEPCWAGRC